MGSITFSITLRVGKSWKNWKMMPTVRPRQGANCPSFKAWIAVSPMNTWPVVGRSMPVIMLISVDLPLPDLPITATNSPRSTCRLISLSALNGPAAVE